MSRRLLRPVDAPRQGAQRALTGQRFRPRAAGGPGGRVIPLCEPLLGGNEARYVAECIETNWISSKGRFISAFEQGFAAFCGVKHAVSCTSGTAALHLCLAALDLRPGDEVILPTFTIVSNANAVRLAGGTPVFVDVDPRTYCLTAEAVARALTARTRAVMPVHIYGYPCPMEPLRRLCAERDLWLLEDAAEAMGAEEGGRRCGGLADAAAFSLYANKMITTGEGGVVTTDSDELAHTFRLLRNLAYDGPPHFWHPLLGFNYRMTNLQAAVGLAQLERAEALIQARVDNARRYSEGLGDLPGIVTPPEPEAGRNVHWMYAIRVEGGPGRDGLMAGLARRGVETNIFFVPLHLQPIYYRPEYEGRFPVAERVAAQGLYLPSGSGLGPQQVDYVVAQIRALMAG